MDSAWSGRGKTKARNLAVSNSAQKLGLKTRKNGEIMHKKWHAFQG